MTLKQQLEQAAQKAREKGTEKQVATPESQADALAKVTVSVFEMASHMEAKRTAREAAEAEIAATNARATGTKKVDPAPRPTVTTSAPKPVKKADEQLAAKPTAPKLSACVCLSNFISGLFRGKKPEAPSTAAQKSNFGHSR